MRIFLIILGLTGSFCCANETTLQSTTAASSALPSTSTSSVPSYSPSRSDTTSLNYSIFTQKFELAEQAGPSLSEKITAVALDFVGTPYKSGTLEREGPELLVINLAEVDCWTFVEYCVAIAQTSLHTDTADYHYFEQCVQKLRYRGGIVNGYGSRIHYFEEWMLQQISSNLFEDITPSLGGVPYQKKIAFMTNHPDLYPNLKDTVALQQIRNAEHNINKQTFTYLPKNAILKKMNRCKNGDIIAFSSISPDLDCEHEGFIYTVNKMVYLLHASVDYKMVVISKNNLFDYTNGKKRQTGIMLLRAL